MVSQNKPLQTLWFCPMEFHTKPQELALMQDLQTQAEFLKIIPLDIDQEPQWQEKWKPENIDLVIVHADPQQFLIINNVVKSWNVPKILFLSQPQELVVMNCDRVCEKCVYFLRQDLGLAQGVESIRRYDAVLCFDRESATQIFYEFMTFPTIVDPQKIEDFRYLIKDMTFSLCNKDPEVVNIAWIGEHLYYHSLARINRELILRFVADTQNKWNVRISIGHHRVNFDLCEMYPHLTWRAQTTRFNGKVDYFIAHIWPPPFDYMPMEGKWIVIQPWEFGPVPQQWVPPIRNYVDELWEPSNYIKEGFIESGISSDIIEVIPNGVDPAIYYPQKGHYPLATEKQFKFLFVGGSIHRKGFDILINAYMREFSQADNVVLVVKDIGAKTFYSSSSNIDSMQDLMEKTARPEIIYLTDDLSDKEMAELYNSCDCYVHPYRGEGFGMPIAEAMACGLPVIVTDYGACLDFCNPENAYLIPASIKMLPADFITDYETTGILRLAEPDLNALRELMRFVYTHPKEAGKKGQQASQDIHNHYTWEHMYQRAVERLKALQHFQPKRLSNTDATLKISYLRALEQNDWPTAQASLKHLIQRFPQDASLHYQQAIVLVKQQAYSQAVEHLKEAARLHYYSQAIVRQALTILEETQLEEESFQQFLNPIYLIWDFPPQFWLPPLRFFNHKCFLLGDIEEAPVDSLVIYFNDGSKAPPTRGISVALLTYPYPEELSHLKNYAQIWGSLPDLYDHPQYYAIPLGIDTKRFSPVAEAAEIEGTAPVNLLALFDWRFQTWKSYLQAFCEVFKGQKRVALLLKFYSPTAFEEETLMEEIMACIEDMNISEEDLPDIVLIEQDINNENLPSILKTSVAILIDEGYNSEYLMGAANAQELTVISWGSSAQKFVGLTQSIYHWVNSQVEIEEALKVLRDQSPPPIDLGFREQQSQTRRSKAAFDVLIGQLLNQSLKNLELKLEARHEATE